MRDRILHALRLAGGAERVVKKDSRVLVKPNLVDGSTAETGETTHPQVLATIIEILYQAGAKEVTVGESPPGHLELVKDAVEAAGGKVLNFDDEPYDLVQVRNPFFFPKVRIARSVMQCDAFICAPTLKVNQATGLSVSLKNMYGTIPSEDKLRYHRLDRIEEAIVDLNSARPSDMTIVDGTYSTLHWGPRTIFPETHQMNLTIAGYDPVAVDAVAAKTIGVDPQTLRYLAWADKRGLGTSNLDRIRIVGVPIAEAYERTTTMTEYVNRVNQHVKVVDGASCSGCFGRIPGAILANIRDRGMTEDVYVLMGSDARAPADAKNLILCGDCAVKNQTSCGDPGSILSIEGCPPPLGPLKKRLVALGGRKPESPRDYPDRSYDHARNHEIRRKMRNGPTRRRFT